jgi:alpha/beta superfamily hydrolase
MVKQSSVTFPTASSRAFLLEGVLHIVEGDGQLPAAVICHPHPLGGGSMHNGVVVAIARALASKGVLALRFNFRGVGASEGFHDNGRGERNDVAGALDWLLAQPAVDPRRVSLVGYSFGACVGLAHALADPTVSAFAAVGLAVEFCNPDAIRPFTERGQDLSPPAPGSRTCPKLFITGERDQLAPPGELLELVERLPAPKSVQIFPGADHFWWGSERKVGELVADFITGLAVNR